MASIMTLTAGKFLLVILFIFSEFLVIFLLRSDILALLLVYLYIQVMDLMSIIKLRLQPFPEAGTEIH